MKTQLFDHVDIPKDQAHVPDGTVARSELAQSCADYEKQMHALGGLDFQLLGIGRTGHIGFNEPGSTRQSRTRLITLDPVTRIDAARDFVGLENVPRFAITMGVGTILEAREIALLAWGKAKASVIRKSLEDVPSEEIPASLLQGHPKIGFYLNETAASELTAVRRPWSMGSVVWTEPMIKRAVHSLSNQVKKPILKLVDRDYQLHGLEELLSLHGPAYDLNIRVFKATQNTITGWPGGKPGADDRVRPVPSEPERKRIVVLCSEPGVEPASMGCTLNRLKSQGHDVHLVYMASGAMAVGEESQKRFLSLLNMMSEGVDVLAETLKKMASGHSVKRLLRRHQAVLATQKLALTEEPKFLNLPFYEKGSYRKFQPEDIDRKILLDFLNESAPHQIYITGLMADPTSLEGVCWDLFEQTRPDWGVWRERCQTWLFREMGEFWESHEIDMAVPVSPDEHAIKEASLREYAADALVTSLEESAGVAESYDDLGLPEYEGVEAFKLYRPQLS